MSLTVSIAEFDLNSFDPESLIAFSSLKTLFSTGMFHVSFLFVEQLAEKRIPIATPNKSFVFFIQVLLVQTNIWNIYSYYTVFLKIAINYYYTFPKWNSQYLRWLLNHVLKNGLIFLLY